METADERKFARMTLLDPSDDEDSAKGTTSPLSPKTSAHPAKHRTGSTVRSYPQTLAPTSTGSTGRYRARSLRDEAFGPDDGTTSLHTSPRASTEIATSTAGDNTTAGMRTTAPSTYNVEVSRRRGSSLSARYPGDQTHRPLDIIRRESVKANRAPHLRRRNHHGADSIDQLAAGSIGDVAAWHHEGPYDAASLARNQRWKDSPLEAVASTNRETLRSVHRDKVLDSLQQHRPLDGFAYVPPGLRDRHGNIFYYEEGTDMQRHNGADYKRWPGIDYHPDDLKGKGEPSYSIERALKEHQIAKDHRRVLSEGAGIEMSNRPNRTRSLHVAGSGREPTYSEWRADVLRSESHGHGQSLRRRMGSLRHRVHKHVDHDQIRGQDGEEEDLRSEERPPNTRNGHED